MNRRVAFLWMCVAGAGCAGAGRGTPAEVNPAYVLKPPRTVAIPPAINRSDELNPETTTVLWQRVRLPGQAQDRSSRENPVLSTFRWAIARELAARGMRPVLVDPAGPAWKRLSTRERHDPQAVGKACGADAVCRLTMQQWHSRSLSGSARVRFHTEYSLVRSDDRLTLWRYTRGSQWVRLQPGVEGSGLASAIGRDVTLAFKTLP